MLAQAPQGELQTSSQPEIRIERLTKRFGDVVAVDDISLDVRVGEFFSLLGPSGCGKTTTLRMLGGFDLPTSGRISLRGRDVTHEPPDRRPVNMVFQGYALFPHLDVAGNIAFGLRRRGVDGSEIRRRTAEVLELVACPATRSAGRTSCRAGSSSGSRSPAPSSTSRRRSSSTSRSAPSTSSCASASSSSSSASGARSRSRSST